LANPNRLILDIPLVYKVALIAVVFNQGLIHLNQWLVAKNQWVVGLVGLNQ
jgi:hypothetical protein